MGVHTLRHAAIVLVSVACVHRSGLDTVRGALVDKAHRSSGSSPMW